MKCILLCGGFATRLWPLTLEKPKSLIEIAGKPIINYSMEKLGKTDEVDKIIISTNVKFEGYFDAWRKKYGYDAKIVVEKSAMEKEKLGAIAGIDFVIQKENINDDCIIIAGDNIFGFSLKDFIRFYRNKKSPVMAAFDVKDSERAKLYGVVKIGRTGKILDFEEKPQKPKSTLVSTACYIFPKETLKLFSQYLKEGNSKDAPGFFLQWLYKKRGVYGFVFSEYWFDIGDFSSLEQAKKFMQTRA